MTEAKKPVFYVGEDEPVVEKKEDNEPDSESAILKTGVVTTLISHSASVPIFVSPSSPVNRRRISVPNPETAEGSILLAAKNGIFHHHIWHNNNLIDLNQQDEYGFTLLHYACLRLSIEIVEKILNSSDKVDVNLKTKLGRTGLHLVAKSRIIINHSPDDTPTYTNDHVIAKLLIARDADVNCFDLDGMTPLHTAVAEGKIVVIEALLACPNIDIGIANMKEETALHIASEGGNIRIVNMLIDAFRKKEIFCAKKSLRDIKATDSLRQTPLHKAAEKGHLCVIKRLVNEIVNRRSMMDLTRVLTKSEDINRKTPLFLAVENNRHAVVRYLITHTDKICLEPNKASLLHYAAWLGNIRLLKLIYDPQDKDILDVNKRTPLHYAVESNNLNAIEFLIENQESVDLKDITGITPLMQAIMNGHSQSVKLLIDAKADFTVKDEDGRNIIHYCAINGHLNVLQLLLREYRSHVEKMIDIGDQYENKPLHEAARKGFLSILQCLTEEGNAQINIENSEYNTPLCLAAQNGHPECAYALIRKDCAADLLRHKDLHENTPLHIACSAGHESVTQIFVSRGAFLSDFNSRKMTPLMCAAKNGHYNCCKLVLEFNSDPNIEGFKKYTALHYAAKHGHVGVTQLLLENGANITLKNGIGKNPLEMAIDHGEEKVAKAIVESSVWCDALRNIREENNGVRTTPFRMLINRFPKVAEIVLDRCVTVDRNEQNCDITFEFIEDTCLYYPLAALRTKTQVSARSEPYSQSLSIIEKNHPLMIMVKHGRLNLLGHIVSQTLIDHKWSIYGRSVYYFILSVYLTFLISLTVYVWFTMDDSYAAFLVKQNISSSLHCPDLKIAAAKIGITVDSHDVEIKKMTVIVTSVLNLIKELFQLYQSRLAYFNPENIMEVICPTFAILLVSDFRSNDNGCSIREEWQWQIGGIAVFFAWLDLLFRIRKFPYFGIYVVMMTTVLKTFCKFFIVFILFLLTFTMAFYMAFRSNDSFNSSFLHTLMYTSVMTIGNVEFKEIFFPEEPLTPFGVAIFVLFLILMPILTMNLLVGLAVDDIKSVLADAKLKRLAMKVKLIMDVEMIFPKLLRNYRIFQSIVYLERATIPLGENSIRPRTASEST